MQPQRAQSAAEMNARASPTFRAPSPCRRRARFRRAARAARGHASPHPRAYRLQRRRPPRPPPRTPRARSSPIGGDGGAVEAARAARRRRRRRQLRPGWPRRRRRRRAAAATTTRGGVGGADGGGGVRRRRRGQRRRRTRRRTSTRRRVDASRVNRFVHAGERRLRSTPEGRPDVRSSRSFGSSVLSWRGSGRAVSYDRGGRGEEVVLLPSPPRRPNWSCSS